jgi:hypothetical protein
MKIIIKNIINENIDLEEKYINGISNIINIPYFYNLKVTDTPEHLWNRILSKKFNQEVRVQGNGINNSNNNQIYYETKMGGWEKREFDKNNNIIYYENSNGYWEKRELDKNNNEIYFEDSDGYILDNRPSNPLNENIDINPEQRFINGIVNFIRLPYIYNLSVNEVPKELWNRILSKVFKQKVREYNNYIYDSNNNEIYREDSDGFWVKQEYDKKNNLIYFEDSDGDWEKREFDSNNNQIYFENSNGYWAKQEYDSNNNSIYYEKSNGYWEKKEYDSNNNQIYFENSNGYWDKSEYDSNNIRIYFENSSGHIKDNRPSSSINENIDPEEKFINGIVKFINVPYFYNLRVTETPEHLWNRILSKVFKQEVTVSNNYIFDSNNNKIYREYSDGDWEKKEYDSNNNEVYFESSNGFWLKREYDSNNNLIYWEYSDGEWYKQEFDSNNNRIYFEDSNGKIIDKRNINENIDPEEKYVNGIVNFIRLPYFYNLKVTETPEELWDRILSKVYNQEVINYVNGIYDSNNNEIYYENSEGDWEKQEYDKNNNKIYFEDSNGYWEKSEYDSNNIRIYFENSNGYWWKQEYDSNNNKIYFENSNGYWWKQEYDSNNNSIYYEDSDGKIIDNRPSNPLNENIDITPEEKYINGLSNMIRTPYFYNLKVTETPKHLWNRILSKIFNREVRLSNNYIFDSNNNQIYYEDSDGDWEKREFDKKNNLIYYENSDGYWIKREFDSNNNKIYYEDSDGNIVDNRPSSSINENNTI